MTLYSNEVDTPARVAQDGRSGSSGAFRGAMQQTVLPSREDTIERMLGQLLSWETVQDRRCIFLKCYSMMTNQMLHGIDGGSFHDPAWVDQLLRRFALYYFDALDAYDGGGMPPLAWKKAHDLAHEELVLAPENLMLGINAHINHDLPLVRATCLEPDWQVMFQPRAARGLGMRTTPP